MNRKNLLKIINSAILYTYTVNTVPVYALNEENIQIESEITDSNILNSLVSENIDTENTITSENNNINNSTDVSIEKIEEEITKEEESEIVIEEHSNNNLENIISENINSEDISPTETSNTIKSTIEDNWVNREVAKQIYGDETKYIDLSDSDYLSIYTISLSNSSLTGDIPSDFYKLKNLSWLNLSNNNLTGSLSTIIDSFPNLADLKLDNNNFTGEIPSSIGNLTNLQWFNVSNNNLSGNIPSSIGNLSNLEQFTCGNNNLTGSIPSEIGNLAKLTELDLQHNNLTGTIPGEIGNLSNMRWLKLNDNNLTGNLPSELSNLRLIESLTVKNNNLYGTISESFANLTNLQWFTLSNNQFTGVVPEAVKNMTSVNDFQFNILENEYNQKQLNFKTTSDITLQLGEDLDTSNLRDNIYLTWEGNQEELLDVYDVSAVLDPTYFSNTTSISIGDTYLKAKISSESDSNNAALTSNSISISIVDNNIESNWVNEEVARLKGKDVNSLTEQDYLSITDFNLSNNSLKGSIPDELYKLKNLKWLNLSKNDLTGTIDDIINSFPNLISLDLSSNNFSGSIPSSIGSLSNLKWLVLSNNKLSGELPNELFSLSSIIQLSLRNNNFSGAISSDLGNLITMTEIDLSENEFSGSIPSTIGNLINLKWILFNDNKFTGSIPSEIGDLKNAISINLRNNRLSGLVPVELSNLTNLSWLTLSNNQLIGEVPEEVKNMTSDNNYEYNFFKNEYNQKQLYFKDKESIEINLGESLNISIPHEKIIAKWDDKSETIVSEYNVETILQKDFFNGNTSILPGVTEVKAKIGPDLDNPNSITTNSIEVKIKDITAPLLDVYIDNNEWTNDMVDITVSATDDHEIKKIILPDGTESLTSTLIYNVFANGTYRFIAVDESGNETIKDITITNIDKTLPTVNVNFNNSLTNSNVEISIEAFDNESGIRFIKLPGDKIVESTNTSFIVKENGTYIVEVRDHANNIQYVSINIDNIDTEGPSIVAIPTITEWTNKSYNIKVSASDKNGISKIVLPDGSILNSKEVIYNVKNNGTYTFEAFDTIGNKSSINVLVENIDTTKPIINIEKSKLKDDNSIDLFINATDKESGIKSIYLNNDSQINLDNPIINIKSNGIYKILVSDLAGNISEETITISNIIDASEIDTEEPKISYSLSNYNITNEDVIINIIATDNKGIKEIRTPDGNVLSSSAAVYSVSTNGDYTFEVSDINNNTANITVSIDNIDKSSIKADIVKSSLLPDNTIDLTLNINKDSDYIDSIKINDNIHVDSDNPTLNVNKNGTYQFYIEDTANNKTIVKTVVNDIVFTGIDTEAPEINYLLSEYNWTNNSIDINVQALDNNEIKHIKTPDGNIIENTFYTFTVYENGAYIFEVEDIAGNTNSITITIDNIDIDNPNLKNLNINYKDNSNIAIVDIEAEDSRSGIKSIILPNGIYSNNIKSTIELPVNNTYEAIIEDNAGNINKVSFLIESSTIEDNNRDEEQDENDESNNNNDNNNNANNNNNNNVINNDINIPTYPNNSLNENNIINDKENSTNIENGDINNNVASEDILNSDSNSDSYLDNEKTNIKNKEEINIDSVNEHKIYLNLFIIILILGGITTYFISKKNNDKDI